MKNHFRGATPEFLAKAPLSKNAVETKRKLRLTPKPDSQAPAPATRPAALRP